MWHYVKTENFDTHQLLKKYVFEMNIFQLINQNCSLKRIIFLNIIFFYLIAL